MEIDEFIDQNQEKLDKIIEIQDLLFNIDNNNIDESIEEINNMIEEFPFLKSKEGLTYLLKALKFAMISRPFFNESHFSLILNLKENINKLFSSNEIFSLFSLRFFNLKLFELKMIDFSSILNTALKDVMTFFYFSPEIQENNPDTYNQKLSNDNWLKMKIYSIGGSHNYSSKNMKKNSQIDSKLDIENSIEENSVESDEIASSTPSSNTEKCTTNECTEAEKSLLKKFKGIRDVGFNEHKLAEKIRIDDVNEVQKIISQTNLDLKTTIPRSLFERCNFVNDGTASLLEYSAFCGSINVFKFLIMKSSEKDDNILNFIQNNSPHNIVHNNVGLQSIRDQAKLMIEKSQRLGQYAIAGGNYDIIHILEDKKYIDYNVNMKLSLNNDPVNNTSSNNLLFGLKYNFNELFNASIQFHRNEIFDYLAESCFNDFYEEFLDKNKDNILIENFNASILYYNFEIFLKLLPIVVKNDLINSQDADGETPLHIAAINGHLDLVKILCSIKGININARTTNLETPLQWAISYGHIDVVQYILDLDGIDYLGENKVGVFIFFIFFYNFVLCS